MNRAFVLLRHQYVPFATRNPRFCVQCSASHAFRGFSAQTWKKNGPQNESLNASLNEQDPANASAEVESITKTEEDVEDNVPKSTKKASRLARKQRRMEAGVWRTKAQAHAQSFAWTPEKSSEDAQLLRNEQEDSTTEPTTTFERLDVTALENRVTLDLNSENVTSGESQSTSIENENESNRDIPQWKLRKQKLKERLQGGQWRPTKRLSPETVEGIRALSEAYPDRIDLPMLAQHFGISYEAMRRILKSKSWKPSAEQMEERLSRWERRGARIWNKLDREGVKPSRRWQRHGVGKIDPDQIVPQWKQQEWWESNIEKFLRKDEKRSEKS